MVPCSEVFWSLSRSSHPLQRGFQRFGGLASHTFTLAPNNSSELFLGCVQKVLKATLSLVSWDRRKRHEAGMARKHRLAFIQVRCAPQSPLHVHESISSIARPNSAWATCKLQQTANTSTCKLRKGFLKWRSSAELPPVKTLNSDVRFFVSFLHTEPSVNHTHTSLSQPLLKILPPTPSSPCQQPPKT